MLDIPCPPPVSDNLESIRFSWLLCQLQALEACHAIITVGGKLDGAANMLLLLAESKKKVILPLSYFGGAAEQVLKRRKYEFLDKLGDSLIFLEERDKIELAMELLPKLLSTTGEKKVGEANSFFISYPRARPNEADCIETFLRRRNKIVHRDDNDFGAGHSIQSKIREAIFSSNIFIATWCQEYACSPWCFDEIEMALDRVESGSMDIWIFCVDNTRIVPKRARDRVAYFIKSRQDIENTLANLLSKLE
ncbi:toll/interleukin-1 receptor domain-containing protein [uncultured Paenibacillus sp.]|uniref:toll/interleukin-1 receptor domain-containing protein n=1 Tax=uncultured Paenibacillus sp. TaxID=227322 RepID=UPI0015AC4832|nr:toll/interleukin-1 receptor domain-containing protein [uncultured Paenibacillus sp.]